MSTDMSTAQVLYTDREYCYTEVCEAQLAIADPSRLDSKMIRNIGLGLGIMLLHCPDDMVVLISLTLEELAKVSVNIH